MQVESRERSHLDARVADLVFAQVEFAQLLLRPKIDFSGVFARVQPIVDAVRERGDEAVLELTAQFDRVTLPPEELCVDVASLPEPELAP
mgnify:CR=1 FL=1